MSCGPLGVFLLLFTDLYFHSLDHWCCNSLLYFHSSRQTSGSKVDPDTVCGHQPPLLCQDGHADLRSVTGRAVSLEQGRLCDGPGWILLGLLLDTDRGRTCQWQVSNSASLWLHWVANTKWICAEADCRLLLFKFWFRVGGERVLFLSATSWSLVTAATPLLVYLGSHTLYLMTMARFLMGVLQGEYCSEISEGLLDHCGS